MVDRPLYGDRDDEDVATVARTVMAMKGGRTAFDRVEVGNRPVAGNGGAAAAAAEVGVFAGAAVEIARMTGPYRAQIRCIRLDFPVVHCRRVLCHGKPAPRSRRLSAHRRDHDP